MLVRCHPSGRSVEVPPGTRLFDAVRATGLPVGTACEGGGICGRCALRVLQGGLSPETAAERAVKRANAIGDDARLSCLAQVEGDVTVTASWW